MFGGSCAKRTSFLACLSPKIKDSRVLTVVRGFEQDRTKCGEVKTKADDSVAACEYTNAASHAGAFELARRTQLTLGLNYNGIVFLFILLINV